MYTAHILRATGNPNVPQARWNGVKVFLPTSQKLRIIRDKAFDLAASYRPYRIFQENLAAAAPKSVMLFRPSMMRDVEGGRCLTDARLICSVWSGYLQDEKSEHLLDWLRLHDIPLVECHTSGHASIEVLIRLRKAFQRAHLVPIHTTKAGSFCGEFPNVRPTKDGESWEVARCCGAHEPRKRGVTAVIQRS
jgi:ribonuclease J